MKSWKIALLTGLALLAAFGMWSGGRLPADEAKDAPLVYELRTYTANSGKMEELHKRFRDHTMKLFEKHGMKNIAYWTPLDKPDTLVYVIAHKSRDEAKKSWETFKNDPEGQAAYKESHKNGPLVMKVESQFLAPTKYSPMK
jgi:hypothetical protein